MKRIFFSLIILLLIINSKLFSLVDENTSGLKLKIDFANPRIYRENDDVLIELKLYNTSSNEVSTLISQDKKFSFDFEMVTMQNRPVYHSEDYITSFNRVQRVFNTLIRINNDEGYTYIIRLNDYYQLNQTGQFFIRAHYYPDLKLNHSDDNVIYSNFLTLNIRPGKIQSDFVIEKKEMEEEKNLYAQKRPPDEVIDYMLKSRMNEEWEKYFLYLDLEQLILMNNNFKYKYQKADSETQYQLIEDYKEYLKLNVIEDINFLPHSYKIIRTEYSEGIGKVEAILQFKQLDFIEKKYYTYFLKKKGNIWYIYNYEVRNLGIR